MKVPTWSPNSFWKFCYLVERAAEAATICHDCIPSQLDLHKISIVKWMVHTKVKSRSLLEYLVHLFCSPSIWHNILANKVKTYQHAGQRPSVSPRHKCSATPQPGSYQISNSVYSSLALVDLLMLAAVKPNMCYI